MRSTTVRASLKIGLAGVFLQLTAGPVRAQRFEAGTPALIQGSDRVRWGVGFHGGMERRQVAAFVDELRFHVQRQRIRLHCDAIPGTDLWAEGGAARAWTADEEPHTGSEWGAGIDLHLFERVIRGSRVVPRKEWVGVNLLGSFRETRVDVGSYPLRWREWRGGAVARYGRMREPEEAAGSPLLMGQALRAGVVQAHLEDRSGLPLARENRDLGMLFGFDLLWSSGWVGRIELVMLGANDGEFGFALSRFF